MSLNFSHAHLHFDRIRAFEGQLDPAYPLRSPQPPQIIGYGEISSVLVIPGMPDFACKRMPPFPDSIARRDYMALIDAYCIHLRAAGVSTVPYRFVEVDNCYGEAVLYIVQPLLPGNRIGSHYLRHCAAGEFERAMGLLVDTVWRVWQWNSTRAPALCLGLDAQISNWFFEEGETPPAYLDYSTPFLRDQGREQLNTEIFLKSLPALLVPVVRRFFLQEILDRYYDVRQVLIDLVANFSKEKMQRRIPAALSLINDRLRSSHLGGPLAPITEAEVRAYYRSDARLWRLLLALRRVDRFVKTRIAGCRYNFILPGRIER